MLLIFAPSYAVLAFLASAALLVIGILMQRRIDRREAEQIEATPRATLAAAKSGTTGGIGDRLTARTGRGGGRTPDS